MLPFILACVAGICANAYASSSNKEAIEKNELANEIINESNNIAQESKKICEDSMNKLANKKLRVLHGNMKRFVKNFSKIKPVNFSDTGDLFEIAKFNKNELMDMQSMIANVKKININNIVGDTSKVALALGAADILTSGSLLSGAGISISGLTGGAALGAIAAPFFAITGIFSASEAAANLEKAKSNLSKAYAYQDEVETYSYLAYAVSKRCDLFYETLDRVDTAWFTSAVDQLETLVNSKKTFINFLKNITGKKIYSPQEMQMLASVASLAKMVKTIINTNILDNNGNVTENSKKVILEIQNKIDNEDLTVRMPTPVIQNITPILHNQHKNMTQTIHTKSEAQISSTKKPSIPIVAVPTTVVTATEIAIKEKQSFTSKKNLDTSKPLLNKTIYNPNIFVKFIMWIHLIFNCFFAISMIFAGYFIPGSFLMAAGLIMYPKINTTMKFWPRYGIMMLLYFISGFFM